MLFWRPAPGGWINSSSVAPNSTKEYLVRALITATAIFVGGRASQNARRDRSFVN